MKWKALKEAEPARENSSLCFIEAVKPILLLGSLHIHIDIMHNDA